MQKIIKKEKTFRLLSLFIILFVLIVSYLRPAHVLNFNERLIPPSFSHIFGTDHMGRNVFFLSIEGFRNTFLIALLSQVIPFFFGGLIGAAIGFYKTIFDEFLLHLMNIMLTLPMILSAIFLSAVIGNGLITVLIVISIFGFVYNIKLVRAEISVVKNEDFILALRVNGVSDLSIFIHNILPRAYYLLLPILPLIIAHSMIAVSSFSFLGMSFDLSTPELGTILKDSLRFSGSAPWLIIFPGLFQFICVMIFTKYSDLLEERLKQGGGVLK